MKMDLEVVLLVCEAAGLLGGARPGVTWESGLSVRSRSSLGMSLNQGGWVNCTLASVEGTIDGGMNWSNGLGIVFPALAFIIGCVCFRDVMAYGLVTG